jgi:hypothetical protein
LFTANPFWPYVSLGGMSGKQRPQSPDDLARRLPVVLCDGVQDKVRRSFEERAPPWRKLRKILWIGKNVSSHCSTAFVVALSAPPPWGLGFSCAALSAA